ncbi:hypothetical protein SISSUDRAFT_1027656 [Sistotremastrum suecicum HHB10207 ss-3]|uniref:Uncharacterized protein n=1 Tax=Sistotremastrum suecicum HHB10207 ss-3 TaxID=1314776 RepID=A0A165YN57_9AGAM|nr:hypothetical protein SISSUDRAFT_1027656 [Sistotremastrum suecicum HHB10207 ss-3]
MFTHLEYNNLPTVEVAHDASRPLEAVRAALCDLILKYGLQDVFMVRLVHKHFDMHPGEVPVFRPVEVHGVCTAILMGPLSIENQASFSGVNYAISSTGQLAPYEYTSEVSLGAPENYPDFVKAFEAALISGGASRVFGLGVKSARGEDVYTEFELGEYRSTIMVPKAIAPVDKDDVELHTNWSPSPNGEPVPQDGCTTFLGNHRPSQICISSRSAGHRKKKHINPDGTAQEVEDSAFNRALVDSSSDLSKVVAQVISICA